MAAPVRRVEDDMLEALDRYTVARDTFWTAEHTTGASVEMRERAFRQMQAYSSEVITYATVLQALKRNNG